MSASTPATLFDNGGTDYKIVIAQDAGQSEQFAAAELAKYLKQISGADFQITPPSDDSAKQIIIGFDASSKYIKFKLPPIGDEDFMIFNQSDRIFILGGKKRGTLYGVYTFLEEILDCRWYTSKVTVIPEKKTFSRCD